MNAKNRVEIPNWVVKLTLRKKFQRQYFINVTILLSLLEQKTVPQPCVTNVSVVLQQKIKLQMQVNGPVAPHLFALCGK